MREVILAKTAGFCFGVKRAVDLVERTVSEGKAAATLGPIIHNRHVVDRFAQMGVRELSSLSELKEGETVIIRSHGVAKSVYDEIAWRGISYVDATCPFVERIHELVRKADLEGKRPIIFGQRSHPEVMAIAGWCSDPLCFESPEEVLNWAEENPYELDNAYTAVFQTTSSKDFFEKCSKNLKKVPKRWL